MPHDKDHYRFGLRKWSAFPVLSRVSLCVSVLALLVSLLTQCTTG